MLTKNYYDSLIELLHALAQKNGIKIIDHISFTYYLKEVLKHPYQADLFDRYRKIRNGLVYYGKRISSETAQQGAKDMIELIDFIKQKYLKELR